MISAAFLAALTATLLYSILAERCAFWLSDRRTIAEINSTKKRFDLSLHGNFTTVDFNTFYVNPSIISFLQVIVSKKVG